MELNPIALLVIILTILIAIMFMLFMIGIVASNF